jgi:hypothetical protein
MTVLVEETVGVAPAEADHGGSAATAGFPARAPAQEWPRTLVTGEQAVELLGSAPFAEPNAAKRTKLTAGTGLLLEWLGEQPGHSWQQRWRAGGLEENPGRWRGMLAGWAAERGHGGWRQEGMVEALPVAIAADLIRPSLPWLVGGALARGGRLVAAMTARDPDGFARLRTCCVEDDAVNTAAAGQSAYRTALILAAKGGGLGEVTVGDVVELLDAEGSLLSHSVTRGALFYRLMHHLGGFGPDAPATLRALRTSAQRSPQELIDRYGLVCRPVRDLLVEYLKERQPALDYTSLVSLANMLANLFWADLERHHPGIDSLALPRALAEAWKRRLRTVTRTKTSQTGEKIAIGVERINYRECLTPVRAFYLDLAHWAVEEPQRWAHWVAPCPVGAEEINRKKAKRLLKSRMDTRTRDRLPVLPVLVAGAVEHRDRTAGLLAAARLAEPDTPFAAAGTTMTRRAIGRGEAGRVWVEEAATGKRRDLAREDDHAFWAWAAVEVLRATGVRVEELTELSHHSLVQYRLPTTGELVPLLQIAPSKTDTERLLVVSPELADVLATILTRIRRTDGSVPLVPAYDQRERRWAAPAPLLFQRRVAAEQRAITTSGIRDLLDEALARTGLRDPADGKPLHYTPHDFRRMFITDAILNGLPPHIAQVIAGHQDINVTLGYKATYPQEQIQAHLAFLARRRALRPSEEYRTPNDEEWQEFLGHFQRRKLSVGTCARAFATPCIHEHACVRCPMLWPDPTQRERLVEIRENLTARIAEAQREGWLGELEGLQVSLAGAEDKLAQLDRRPSATRPTDLGMPTTPAAARAAG